MTRPKNDKIRETLVPSLPPEALYRPARLGGLSFTTTAELPEPPALVGQDRARDALALAIETRRPGYNVFMLGPSGIGKRSLVEDVLNRRVATDPTPDDWCYVNNFEMPNRPRALRLGPGEGNRLKAAMKQFVEELRLSIPAVLESEEFRSRSEQIEAEFSSRQEDLFNELGAEAVKDGIALVHTPAGFSLAPMREGHVITPDQFQALPEEERDRLENRMLELQDKLQQAIRRAQELEKSKRNGVKELTREMTLSVVGTLAEELKRQFTAAPAVQAYADAVQADVLETIDQFRKIPQLEGNPFAMALNDSGAFRRYEVNVVIGAEARPPGAPVVIEDYPAFPNLVGRIENLARMGALVTDFSLIQPGALHRANGGYLVIDAHKLLTQPFAWEALKRALSSRLLRLETVGQSLGLVMTVSLEPEPIPLDVKVILIGERLVYYLLLSLDPEFGELFKIAADFEDDIERSAPHEELFARLVGSLARKESLLPLDRSAVGRIVEEASRCAADSERLSARLEDLLDVLRESDLVARKAGASAQTASHVQQALHARDHRHGRIRQRMLDAVLRGEILLDTDGAVVGQINALSVSGLGRLAFGHPTRITATTRLGDGEVIDIHREVELGGPIHSKGVLTLSAFLASRYLSDRPHSLTATLAFEQTYGEVEGDSASMAELAVLLSSLANIPIRQSLAITGSVNQHGEAQPIGGVNEKIEGFFDVCAARGLTGRQGVIIPKTNVPHLMLKPEVVEAVRDGRFGVFAVSHADEALELLTGVEAGAPDDSGNFPEGTFNLAVSARLLELSLMRQAYAQMTVKLKSASEPKAKAAPRSPPKPKS